MGKIDVTGVEVWKAVSDCPPFVFAAGPFGYMPVEDTATCFE